MPRLVVVCGLPGVGKSTTARERAAELDARRCDTDAVRKEFRPDPRYDREETRLVYARVLDRARTLLDADTTVVLDGTFRRARHRRWARDLAEDLDCPFDLVRVVCEESVAVDRIADRDTAATTTDATVDVYHELAESFEAVDADHTRIDNSGPAAAMRRAVREWCAERRDRRQVSAPPPR